MQTPQALSAFSRRRVRSSPVLSRTLALLALVAGCGPEPTPEELAADGTLPPVKLTLSSEMRPQTKVDDGVERSRRAVSIDQTGAGITYQAAQGSVINAFNVRILYYGNWSGTTATTLQANTQTFLADLSASKWFNIQSLYPDKNNASGAPDFIVDGTANVGYLRDSMGRNITNLSQANVNTIVQNAVANGTTGPFNFGLVYVVIASADVTANTASGNYCTFFCAYHTFTNVTPPSGGTFSQPFALALDPGTRCNSCFATGYVAGTGTASLDAISTNVAHELAETVSDPQLNAWLDASGNENADKCTFTTPRIRNVGTGGFVNNLTGRSGRNYYLQDNWMPLGSGFCAGRWAWKNNVAWLNPTLKQVSVWQMNGPANLRATMPGATYDPATMAFVGFGDITGDGNADIVFRNTSSGAIVIWPMVGLTRGTVLTSSAAGSQWTARAVGDMDGDGIADIFWTTSTQTSTWLMNANGTVKSFTNPLTIPTSATLVGVGDLHNDKKADVIWHLGSGHYRSWKMNGGSIAATANFDAPVFQQAVMGGGIFAGIDHLVIRHANGISGVYINTGTVVVVPLFVGAIGSDWTLMAAGDFDGNGETDLMWRRNDGNVSFWGRAAGQYSFPSKLTFVSTDWQLKAAGSDITF
jgi:hypothetical protein